MHENELTNGGCACGAIRYTLTGSPAMVVYCHCDECRKSCGSVVGVMAGFEKSGFELINKDPAFFNSTPAVKRSFCKDCGSPLFYENQNFSENIYIHIGSFDHPEKLPPDRHSWVSERICWYSIKDDLTQYDQLSNAGLANNTPPYNKPKGVNS